MGFGDLFRTIFGGGGGFGGYEERNRGQDIAYDIEVTLEEAAKGTEKEIEIPRTEHCESAAVQEQHPAPQPKLAQDAAAQAESRTCAKQDSPHTYKSQLAPHAEAKAKSSKPPAATAAAADWCANDAKSPSKSPWASTKATNCGLRGEGESAPNEGENGDLYVLVHVRQHPQFMREGDDLWHVAMITYPQAALGAEITVPTLDGPTTVKVHPGTQVGETITLRGKGMPSFRGYGRGDLQVRIGVSVPQNLRSARRRFWSSWLKNSAPTPQRKSKFRI